MHVASSADPVNARPANCRCFVPGRWPRGANSSPVALPMSVQSDQRHRGAAEFCIRVRGALCDSHRTPAGGFRRLLRPIACRGRSPNASTAAQRSLSLMSRRARRSASASGWRLRLARSASVASRRRRFLSSWTCWVRRLAAISSSRSKASPPSGHRWCWRAVGRSGVGRWRRRSGRRSAPSR